MKDLRGESRQKEQSQNTHCEGRKNVWYFTQSGSASAVRVALINDQDGLSVTLQIAVNDRFHLVLNVGFHFEHGSATHAATDRFSNWVSGSSSFSFF